MNLLRRIFIFITISYIHILGQLIPNKPSKLQHHSTITRTASASTSAPTSISDKPSLSPIAKKVSYSYFSVTQHFFHIYNNAFAIPLSTQVLQFSINNLTNALNLPGTIYINISSAVYTIQSSGTPGNATLMYNITYPYLQGSDYVYYYFQISNAILNSLKNHVFNKVYSSYCAQLQSGLLYSKASSAVDFSDPYLLLPHKLHNATGSGTGSGTGTSTSTSTTSSSTSSLDTTSIIVISVLAAASICAVVAAVLVYLLRRKRSFEETRLAIAKELGGFAEVYGNKAEQGQVQKKVNKGKVCEVCNEKIHPHHETIELEENIFHRDCGSCEECDCDLTTENFTQHRQGKTLILLCKPHYTVKFPYTEYVVQKSEAPTSPITSTTTNPLVSNDATNASSEEIVPEPTVETPAESTATVAIRKKTVVAQSPPTHTVNKPPAISETSNGWLSWLRWPSYKSQKEVESEEIDLESAPDTKRSKRKEKLAKKVRKSNDSAEYEDDTDDSASVASRPNPKTPQYPNPYYPYPDPMAGAPGYGMYGPGAFRPPYGPPFPPPYYGAPGMPLPGDPYSAMDPYIMQLARAKAAEAEAKRIADELEIKRLADQAEIKRRAREEELRILEEENERSRIQQEKIRANQERQRQEAAAEVQRMFAAAEKERLAQELEVKNLAQRIVAQRIAEEEEAIQRAQEEEQARLAYEAQLQRELNEQYERKRIAFEKAFDRKVQSDEEKRRAEFQRRKELEDTASRRALEERARARALEATENRQRMAGMMNDISAPEKMTRKK